MSAAPAVQTHPMQAPELQHQAQVAVYQALAQTLGERWQAGDEQHE